VARVLFLTSSFPSDPEDGVCGYVYDLARRLTVDHGHDVRVLAPESNDGRGVGGFEPVRVERFTYPWFGRKRFHADTDLGALVRASRAHGEAGIFSATFAARALRAARWADVVCSHWLVPAGLAGALVRRRSRPHVAVAHGGDVHLLASTPGGGAVARTVAARSDRLVFVSADLAGRFSHLAPGAERRSEVVPMGADLGPAAAQDEVARLRATLDTETRVVALFLGRLVSIKGVDVLLDAASRAPGVAVWIAGEGPEEERLRVRAEAARLPVSFFGKVDRMRRRALLEACDVVVMPSRVEPGGRAEGMPVVCAEAFAVGRPVVATRTGGLAEAVEDGRTGFLVPADDAEALTAALVRLGSDDALAARLRSGARTAAYGAERTAAQFDRILRSVVSDQLSVVGSFRRWRM
jgi:glycosyltransferase involved in cell wall biosynthesis